MKKQLKLLTVAAVICASTLSVNALAKEKVPYTHPGFYTNAPTQVAVNFVSIKDIQESLKGQPPMTVSFDIDDTLVFSSSYFYYAFTNGEKLGFGKTPRQVLDSQKFWDYMAEQADRSSIPKKSAKELIAMHLKRGDKIAFITARTKGSKDKNGTITETAKVLSKALNLPAAIPVWYAPDPLGGFKHDKTFFIKKVGSKIHYGDSDSDILAAKEAGVRGIRVQRSYSSTNRQNLNGGYGEEVLINSAW